MTMKKICSVFLSLCLVCMLFIPCFAAGHDVRADVETNLADGTLTVTLKVPDGSGFATFASTLRYDTEKLELGDVAYGAGDLTMSNTETAGLVKLSMIWTATQQTEATLATITFKVKDGANGKTALTFTDTLATDAADAEINVSFGESNTLEIALTDAPPTDEKIPSTAGKYAAAGSAVVVVAAAAVVVSIAVKRKKEDA